jgi:hypothetical protein
MRAENKDGIIVEDRGNEYREENDEIGGKLDISWVLEEENDIRYILVFIEVI